MTGNFVIFIPLGVIYRLISNHSCKEVFRYGFWVSLVIEGFQFFTTLRCFEVENLIHNSFGTLCGFALMSKIRMNYPIEKTILYLLKNLEK